MRALYTNCNNLNILDRPLKERNVIGPSAVKHSKVSLGCALRMTLYRFPEHSFFPNKLTWAYFLHSEHLTMEQIPMALLLHPLPCATKPVRRPTGSKLDLRSRSTSLIHLRYPMIVNDLPREPFNLKKQNKILPVLIRASLFGQVFPC